MLSVPVVLLSTAVFLALIANLALKPAFSSRLTLRCIIVSAAAGLIIYGVGFAEATGNLALSVVRTPLSVTRMFAGINELAAIEGTALVRSPLGLTLFWLVHMLAFFSTASAVLVFPAPVSPTSPRVSFWAMSRVIPFTASDTSFPTTYRTLRFLICSSFSLIFMPFPSASGQKRPAANPREC